MFSRKTTLWLPVHFPAHHTLSERVYLGANSFLLKQTLISREVKQFWKGCLPSKCIKSAWPSDPADAKSLQGSFSKKKTKQKNKKKKNIGFENVCKLSLYATYCEECQPIYFFKGKRFQTLLFLKKKKKKKSKNNMSNYIICGIFN